ncbi:uroporphyrinogen III methyltransferase [Phaeobacter inhibens]|nr:uroporphyrinogen III methyltransferase [Phaeobacter inhibens]
MTVANNPEGRVMVGLLMTRPRVVAERFVEDLPSSTRATLQVIYAPLIRTTPLNPPSDPSERGLFSGDAIFSSANGVRYSTAPVAGQNAYCVGQRTTQAAAAKGWRAICCGLDADALVQTLTDVPPAAPLTHLRGVHSRGDIVERLRLVGINCREHVIYDQILLPYDSEVRIAMDAQASLIVPLFSPRTAQQFVKLAPYCAELHLIAFSKAVADPLKGLKCKDLQICKSPTATAMRTLVRDAAASLARVEGGPSAQ